MKLKVYSDEETVTIVDKVFFDFEKNLSVLGIPENTLSIYIKDKQGIVLYKESNLIFKLELFRILYIPFLGNILKKEKTPNATITSFEAGSFMDNIFNQVTNFKLSIL